MMISKETIASKMRMITLMRMRMSMLISCLTIMFGLSGCSGYKSTWDCPRAKGIGCSSLEYADEIAREQILLNATNSINFINRAKSQKEQSNKAKTGTRTRTTTTTTITETKAKILLKQDLLADDLHPEEYHEIEIEKLGN